MGALTYLIAASRDGFIAGPRGEVDMFFPEPETLQALVQAFPETMPTPARQAMGLQSPNRRFDTVVMGRATYAVGADQGLLSPYAHLDQYVVSSTLEPAPEAGVEIIRQDPLAAVRAMKQQSELGGWLCGGGKLASALVQEIDELIVKRHPTDLLEGIPMFDDPLQQRRFECTHREPLGDLCLEVYRPA